MAWFKITLTDGTTTTVNVGAVAGMQDAAIASAAAKAEAACPWAAPAVAAHPMREVYMGGGYCVVEAGEPIRL